MKGQRTVAFVSMENPGLSISLVVTDDCNEFFFLSFLSRHCNSVVTKASAEDGKAHAIQNQRQIYQVVAVFSRKNFIFFLT